jgi:Na+-transporting methylmalonyl-CoA/oxaloacetate decarboxylase gamma subunit
MVRILFILILVGFMIAVGLFYDRQAKPEPDPGSQPETTVEQQHAEPE